MQFPVNMFHWYIGLPVVFFFAVRGLASARKTKNRITLYLGISGLLFTFCLAFYGIPPLFTTDSQILTLTTILGDVMLFFALWVMWMTVARIYAPDKPAVRYLIVGVDFIFVLLGIWFSLKENLYSPVQMLQQSNGTWQISFAYSQGYEIISSIQFVSLIFVAARFWAQSRSVNDRRQNWRLKSIAIGFFIVGGTYLVRPFLHSSNYSITISALIALGLVIAGLFIFATSILGRTNHQIQK